MAVCAIAVGAVWMVLSPAPIAQPKKEEPIKRSLAYEQAISQPREDTDEKDPGKNDIPDFETVTREDAPASEDPPAVQDIPADAAPDPAQDMAAFPGAPEPAQDSSAEALPWSTDGAEQWGDERRPPAPRAGQTDPYGPPPNDPNARQDDLYGPPPGDQYARQSDPYGPPPGDPYREDDPYDPYATERMTAPPPDPYATQDPYAAQDPYGQPPRQSWNGQGQSQWPEQSGEEWVQVIVSGSGMRATASEDAPMLFAFPYGRSLKVVSRYEGWVEVTDPKSSATGWMQAHALGPSRAPGQQPYGQNEAYYDEQPRERPGLFKRGGFADMINRALGGGN